MKRIHLIPACILTCLAIVACTQDISTDGYNNGVAIDFGVDQAAVTRGTPITNAKDIPNMSVYAYYTGDGTANAWANKGSNATPNLLNGLIVTQTNGTWSYSNKVYWPFAADARVSFFAYSPVATNDNGIIAPTNPQGTPSLTYTVPTDCTKQQDLMVAVPKKDLNKNNGKNINFSMKHALAAIGFKLSGGGQRVSSIKMKGASTSGTLNMDGTTIQWTNLNAPQTTEFTAKLSGTDYVESTDILTAIVSGDGYLMMIPQKLGGDAELTVTFTNWTTTTIKLSGKEWKAGEKVMYGLEMPESEVIGRFAGEVVSATNGDYEEYYYSKILEMAVIDAPELLAWSSADNITTNISNGMTGKKNTLELYKQTTANYPAAKYCFTKNTNYSTITDVNSSNYQWYLPAQNQTIALWIAKPVVKSSIEGNFYWSSSEDNTASQGVGFGGGTVGVLSKTQTHSVRCVKEK